MFVLESIETEQFQNLVAFAVARNVLDGTNMPYCTTSSFITKNESLSCDVFAITIHLVRSQTFTHRAHVNAQFQVPVFLPHLLRFRKSLKPSVPPEHPPAAVSFQNLLPYPHRSHPFLAVLYHSFSSSNFPPLTPYLQPIYPTIPITLPTPTPPAIPLHPSPL